ncbi:MAG: gamma-glutamyltransferase [Rhodospirillaceae bacterium]
MTRSFHSPRTALLSLIGRAPKFVPVASFVPHRAAVNTADRYSADSRSVYGCGALLAVALLLGGCHPGDAPPTFVGYGAADDPKAVQVGRATMESGGSAADTVVAMAMTMTVTLPSRVGLAGGGLCLIHDPKSKMVRTLDFLPVSVQAGRPPVPSLLRGLYALQAAYGRQHWEQAIGVPESLSAAGTTVSRILAADIQANAGQLAADPAVRRVFLTASGQPLGEGEVLSQPELTATLRTVRQRGVGSFYSSTVSGAIGATVARGLGIDAAVLDGYHAAWRGTTNIENGNDVIHFPDRLDGGDGGLIRAWRAASEADDGAWLGAMVGALGSGTGADAAAAPAATVIAVDANEQAVACVLTLGGPFGSGHMVPGTGMLAAGNGTATGLGGPALVINNSQHTTLFAGGAAAGSSNEGSRSAEASLLTVLHAAAVERIPGPRSLAGPRAAPALDGGVLAEPGVSAAQLGPAASRMRVVPALGRVEALVCLYNRIVGTKSCEAANDLRSSGMYFSVLK